VTPLACSLRTAEGERAFVVGDAPFDAGARFLVWSLSKTLIAAAALRMVERGELALDEEIRVPHAAAGITLRRLLNHSSGLRDYGSVPEYHQAVARGEDPWPVDEWLRRSRADRRLPFPWHYSNIGYFFVRRLLEETRGESLDAILRAELFAPVGVAAFVATERAHLEGVLGAPPNYHPGWVMHGAVVATASETSALFRAIFAGDRLSPAMRAEMLTTVEVPRERAAGRNDDPRYGLGVMTGFGPGIAGHSGGSKGGGSAACYHAGEVTACALATVEDLEAERWAIAALRPPAR